jgi:uncharacterized membrane protein YdbT with pleckstrin-like domain
MYVTMLSMTGATGLTEGEQVVLRLHRHWKTVLGPFLVLAATVAALLVALIYLPSATALARLGLGAVALIIVVVLVLGPLLRWRTTSYELTNRRLRMRAGILSRTVRDFPLSKISDVTSSQGLLDRLLGCGQLVVESPGERGQLILTEIPHVQDVQTTLFQLVENEQDWRTREQPPPLPG